VTGSPVCATIISVSSDEQLWNLVDSGQWDWLGQDREGRALLGSPSHHGPGSFAIPLEFSDAPSQRCGSKSGAKKLSRIGVVVHAGT
jgi:hypothetical protein